MKPFSGYLKAKTGFWVGLRGYCLGGVAAVVAVVAGSSITEINSRTSSMQLPLPEEQQKHALSFEQSHRPTQMYAASSRGVVNSLLFSPELFLALTTTGHLTGS